MHTDVLFEILKRFWRLQAVILWRMEYQESQKIYNHLSEQDLADRRIVVFNTVHFAEFHTAPVNSFWELAESIVQWRERNNCMSPIAFMYSHQL